MRRFVVVLLLLVPALLLLVVGPGMPVSSGVSAEDVAAQREARARRSEEAARYGTDPTTTTMVAPSGEEEDRLVSRAYVVIAGPTPEQLVALSEDMAATGEVGYVPYLVDILRLMGGAEARVALAAALEDLTGVAASADLSDAYIVYGNWMYGEEPVPVSGYVDWKASLYGLIDSDFSDLIEGAEPVLASQLQWGGVRRGGIPEVNSPRVITVDEASYMTPDELTFGAEINGEVRSYPHRILDHHELANDVLGGEPVALANCTLCRTGVLFSRVVDGEILNFETSGLLRNSNKVMVDVQTNSLWNQLTGEAINGELQGTVLDRFPITVTTYGNWVVEHPETGVIAIPDGDLYSYEPGEAYAEYYGQPNVWFPTGDVPDAFDEKELVATLDLDGLRLAVGVAALEEEGPQAIVLGERTIVVVPTGGGARFYDGGGGDVQLHLFGDAGEEALLLGDGTELPRLQSGHSFWFAWYVNFPDTETWG